MPDYVSNGEEEEEEEEEVEVEVEVEEEVEEVQEDPNICADEDLDVHKDPDGVVPEVDVEMVPY